MNDFLCACSYFRPHCARCPFPSLQLKRFQYLYICVSSSFSRYPCLALPFIRPLLLKFLQTPFLSSPWPCCPVLHTLHQRKQCCPVNLQVFFCLASRATFTRSPLLAPFWCVSLNLPSNGPGSECSMFPKSHRALTLLPRRFSWRNDVWIAQPRRIFS
jgi:hypothetical protein